MFCPLRFTYVVTNFHQSHCLGACPSDSSPCPVTLIAESTESAESAESAPIQHTNY